MRATRTLIWNSSRLKYNQTMQSHIHLPYRTDTTATTTQSSLYPSLWSIPQESTQKNITSATQNDIAVVHITPGPPPKSHRIPKYLAGVLSPARLRTQTCIPVKMGRKTKVALWDTGAELSIISEKACRSLELWDSMRRPAAVARSVCQRDIKFIGCVTATFTLAGQTYSYLFHVRPQSPFDIILGTDFMQTCGPVSIDHKQQKFWFAQHQKDAINLVNN